MVARNGEHRRIEPVHELTRRLELDRSRPLRDVTGEHGQVGTHPASQPTQGLDHRLLLGAEVRVGDLQQDAHALARNKYKGLASTRSSRGARIIVTSPSKATFTPWRPRARVGRTTM